MRTKTQDRSASIVKTTTYMTELASQAWRSRDKDPAFPIVYTPRSGTTQDGGRDYSGSRSLQKVIKGGITPASMKWTDAITYNTSTKDGGRYSAYCRCFQTKTEISPQESYWYGGYYYWRYHDGQLVDESTYSRCIWYPGLYGNTATVKQSHIASESEFREAARNSLLSLLAGKPQRAMNLALAVCELKDLGTTVKQLASFSKWCWHACLGHTSRRSSTALGRLLKSIRKRGFKADMRTLAQAYLWDKFGVEPTIQDVENFIHDVSSGKIRVTGAKPRDRLVIGQTCRSYFRVRKYKQNSGGQPDGWPSFNYSRHIADDRKKAWRITVNGTCQFNWKIVTEEYRGCVFARLSPRFEQYKKYFPTNFSWSNPLFRTAWELVPFSFIIDWFIDVGKAIQRLDDLSYVSWTRLAWEEPWISYAKIRTEWYPSIVDVADASYGDLQPPKSTSGWENAYYTYTYDRVRGGGWYRGKRSISYTRCPASDVGVSYWSLLRGLTPERKVRLKRYQITTGMALIVSMSKLFK